MAVAYGYPCFEVLIYDVKNHFKLKSKLRGSNSMVNNMDFTDDVKHLHCNNTDGEIIVYDLMGGSAKSRKEFV